MRKYKVLLLALGGVISAAIIVILAFLALWNRPNDSAPSLAAVTDTSTLVVSTTSFGEADSTLTPPSVIRVASPVVVATRSTPAALTSEETLSPTAVSTVLPTTVSESPWTKAFVAEAGFTVQFPSDWVLRPLPDAGPEAEILSWTPVGPGGMDGVPRGGLMIQVSVTDDPLPKNGDAVSVGDKGYAGTMTTGDLSDPDPFWDPKLIRRVYYEAEGSQWLIQGIFGDEVSESNPNLAIFMRVVQGISHINTPAPTPTPIPTPTPLPTPTPIATVQADQSHYLGWGFSDVIDLLRVNYTCVDAGNGVTYDNGDATEMVQCTSPTFTGFFWASITGPSTDTVRNVLFVTFAGRSGESTAATASRIFQDSLFIFLPRYIFPTASQWIATNIGSRVQSTFADVPFVMADNPDAGGVSWLLRVGWP